MKRSALAGVFAVAFAHVVLAQNASTVGSLTGRVVDSVGAPIAGAAVFLRSASRSGVSDGSGRYRINSVAPGTYTAVVRRLGFAIDSFSVTINAGSPATAPDKILATAAAALSGVTITASSRLNETREAALARRQQADNLVDVQSGDEIRSLPNANAAEALARMPGVSTERDEGEGKFVQIRGTEPRLTNVTIDGAHVPGTDDANRIPKLDAVPTDVLGAVEVSKTLTANMDADAIGGSVNLVSKVPEGAPRGYLAIQGGQQTQLSRTQGQWSIMYGGRPGEKGKLGFLLGANYDRNNRSIEDVEPAWSGDASRMFPGEWDQRDYLYYRTRTGAVGDLDYRFDGGSTVALKGMFSEFHNYGTRFRFDAALGDDSVSSGMSGVGSGATFVRETQRRSPNEQMYGLTLMGHMPSVPMAVTWGANYSGTQQKNSNSRSTTFGYDGPGGNGVPLKYDGSDRQTPRYKFVSASDSLAALNPGNYLMTRISLSNGLATGSDAGAHIDGLLHYSLGDMPSALALGIKVRDERKEFASRSARYVPLDSVPLTALLDTYTDPSFYTTIASGFLMGPQANEGATEAYLKAHFSRFSDKTNTVNNTLASYDGSETIYAGYAMHTSDIGALHVNIGLRAEATHSAYNGHAAATDTNGVTTVSSVPGSQNYLDLFPSVQLRYALGDRSNIRAAVTRGIARPNYVDLAPHVKGDVCPACATDFGNLSAGNPDLKPQHAWMYDLMLERYLTRAGLLSAGVFYKNISDFIYDREFVYHGPLAEFDGYFGTRPENGGDASLSGVEVAYVQRFYMLPGALSGLGVDLNWTHTSSRVELLADTASTTATLGKPMVRHAALARQAPNLANIAGTYENSTLSARLAYQYQGASIFEYGDGTVSPDGDVYMYAHGQVDASIAYNLTKRAQLQVQGLDLNNAIFGFYVGDPSHRYSIQREVYGRSLIVGMKYGF